MGVIKVTKGGQSLKRALEYVEKKSCLSSGKDCSDTRKFALKEMMNTKEMYNKKDGRQYKHYIQSFAHDEITPQKAHQIGIVWADEIFKGFEVYIATHNDRNHVHNHFIVNSVNFTDGKKLHLSKKDLENMKVINDKLCIENNLSVPNKEIKSKEIRSFNQGKYMLFKRIENGENIKSYVLNTALAVQKALKEAKNKTEFINNMNLQGYQVVWQDNRRNITFKDKDGNKVRLSNLEKTFREPKFRKENIEDEFRKFEQQNRRTESYRNNARDDGNTVSKQPSATITGGIQQKIRDTKQQIFGTFKSESADNNANKKRDREDQCR